MPKKWASRGSTHIGGGRLANLVLCVSMLSACSALQPFDLTVQDTGLGTAGPKVARLIANLQCEIYNAIIDDQHELSYYESDPDLDVLNGEHNTDHFPARQFTLYNLFNEINYVAQAQFILQVTGTGGANPSITSIVPYPNPAYSFQLAVNGQYNESADRNITIYSSVDFTRLMKYETNLIERRQQADSVVKSDVVNGDGLESLPCNPKGNTELGGTLGIKETLATGFQAAAMNNAAMWPANTSSLSGQSSILSPTNLPYPFGQISAQVDFTIVVGVNGGPTWQLSHFKGPSSTGGSGGSGGASGGTGGSSSSSSGGGSGTSGGGAGGGGGGSAAGGNQGLINTSRQTRDTLNIIFLPACIKNTFVAYTMKENVYTLVNPNDTTQPSPPYIYTRKTAHMPTDNKGIKEHIQNKDNEMMVGTPGWANYLPPCVPNSVIPQLNSIRNAQYQFLFNGFPSSRFHF